MKLMLTPYDGQRQIGLSGIWTYDLWHASPELYCYAKGADVRVIRGDSEARLIKVKVYV